MTAALHALIDDRVRARFESKVDRNGPVPEYAPDLGRCWVWRGRITAADGYCRFMIASYRPATAHRVSWMIHRGPTTPGLVLDHLCRVRHCVNPNHLEEVTPKENILRGFGSPAQNARKETCDLGHPLSGENLYRHPDGRRACRTCRHDAYLRRRSAS